METRIARILSYLFHPLLMPTYGLLLVFYSRNYIATFTPAKIKFIILGVTFLFTFMLPALNALILLRTGRIRSLEMESTRERIIPYTGAALYYFALQWLFVNAGFPPVFRIVIMGAAISIVLTLIISLAWKISAHAVGIGGIAGAMFGLGFRMQSDTMLLFMATLLVAGLIGFARLSLRAHTPAQVYCGYLLGFVVESALMLF